MDPQERQKRNRELKLETDRQDRDHKKALRAGIASAHEGVETSITPPSHSTTNVPTSAPVAPAASTQQSIPDHAIEVSLGASVLVTHTPTYTRRGILINQPVEVPGTPTEPIDRDSKLESV